MPRAGAVAVPVHRPGVGRSPWAGSSRRDGSGEWPIRAGTRWPPPRVWWPGSASPECAGRCESRPGRAPRVRHDLELGAPLVAAAYMVVGLAGPGVHPLVYVVMAGLVGFFEAAAGAAAGRPGAGLRGLADLALGVGALRHPRGLPRALRGHLPRGPQRAAGAGPACRGGGGEGPHQGSRGAGADLPPGERRQLRARPRTPAASGCSPR